MEARVGSESQQLFVAGPSNMNAIGKRSFEWDLNDWRWDGELFVASPLNAAPSGCRNKQVFCGGENGLVSNSSSSSSECVDFGLIDKGKGEAEKRRRIVVVEEDEPSGGIGSLNLKLGGHNYPLVEANLANLERNNGKKGISQGGSSSYPTCQVEGCDADLSDSKDYHRRHKVCETHAKAGSAIVKNTIQRFCQQCSRFHLLEEFDEGKRSCRRRLAGHNRRRRKTQPDASANGNSSIDERACGSLLSSLLRMLSNLQSVNSKNQSQDEELIAHFLGNLANVANSYDPSSLSRLLQASQDPKKLVTTTGTSSEAVIPSVPNDVHGQESGSPLCSTAIMTCINGAHGPPKQTDNITSVTLTTVDMPTNRGVASPECIIDRASVKDFDLNNTYSDPQDSEQMMEKPTTPLYARGESPNCPSWLLQDSLQSSPPQTSGNSDSPSNQSQSNLHAIAHCRTDRIVFKLFGKDPNDLPLVMRAQILEWLSNSPTDIESYIKPGCIILTIYLRLAESAWVDLCHELDSNLSRLLYNSTSDFWTSGWIFARVRDHAAFIYDGQIVLNIPLLIGDSKRCKILSVRPIAICSSTKAKFVVKGINLAQTTRFLCSFDGMYLGQETTCTLVEEIDTGAEQGLSQCLSFSCLLPDVTGRGFIEFEESGLQNEFFPFIVAEEDVCSEIRGLENAIDITSQQLQEGKEIAFARSQALEFIDEFGWLLRRNHMRSVTGETEFSGNLFALTRFRWLMSFAMSREWSAVVKKLLDILFNNMIDAGGQSPRELALSENLLHIAVQMKSRSMVEILLRYVPGKSLKETNPDQFLFRPDMLGPSGITPLHIAASSSGAESILDALTDDPGLLGIKAWKNIKDNTGFTPEDYALARGHGSYIVLVQKKIDKQHEASTIIVNVSRDKQAGAPKSSKPNIFELSKWLSTDGQQSSSYCNRCSAQQLVYTNSAARTMLYRPVMLSLVGIAAVCVCVGILFKTPPQVFYVSPSFRWELLESGFM